MLTSKTKQPVVKMKSSPTSNSSSSGAKFLKTITPNIRRRRQCDKEKLEIYNLETSNNAGSNDTSNFHLFDVIPTSPITPPAAFLPPGYKKSLSLGESESPWHGRGDDIVIYSRVHFGTRTIKNVRFLYSRISGYIFYLSLSYIRHCISSARNSSFKYEKLFFYDRELWNSAFIAAMLADTILCDNNVV